MDVRNVGPCKCQAHALNAMYLLHGLGEPLSHLHQTRRQLGRQVVEISMVFPRHDQYMPGSYGMDIEEGYEIIIFVNDVCWNFLACNGAKNAWGTRGFIHGSGSWT